MNVCKRHKEDMSHCLPRDSILRFSEQAVNTLTGDISLKMRLFLHLGKIGV